MGYNNSIRLDPNNTVENVSWYECIEFCNALNLREGFEPCYEFDENGVN